MKKCFLSLGLIAAAAFTLTNCTKEIETPTDSVSVPFEIVASTVDTKTVNNGVETTWTDGDALNVFHYFSSETGYKNDGKFELSGENTFKGELSEELTEEACYSWYAFYPYNSKIKTPANTGDEDSYTTIGSSGSGKQAQVGNNSMTHIAGPNYPLAGLVEDIEYVQGDPVEFQMTHLTSLIEFVVKNESESPLKVTDISFTATEDIVGTYYIDFTDFDNVVYTSSGVNYVSSVAKLSVEDAEEIAVGATAKFYMAVKPFTAAAGETLTLLINDCQVDKVLTSDLTFTAGKIKTINCSYAEPESALVGIEGIKGAADEAGTEGGTFVADVENAVVTYVNGNNAYIEDETAGILIYAAGHGLNIGDVLTGRISGTVKIYNGLREITSFTSSAVVTTTDEIPLTTITIEELNANKDKYENMRIQLLDVEVTSSGTLEKDGNSVAYYKKNSSITNLETYNILDAIGYPGYFKQTFQLQIWTSPKLKGASKTLFSGFSTTLSVAVEGTVANPAVPSSGAEVSYVSADNSIATVDENGNVTGVAVGETTITASVDAYNGYPATSIECVVTVTAASDVPSDPITLVVDMDDYVYTNNCTISSGNDVTNYKTLSLDSNISMIAEGTATNQGSFWSGVQWRLYQTGGGKVTVSAVNGYTIQSVTFTYSQDNGGVLKNGTTNVISGSEVTVNNNSITLTVGNTGTKTNGQVRMTDVKVIYVAN